LEEVVDIEEEGPAVRGAALLGEEPHASGHLGLGVVAHQRHERDEEGDDEGEGDGEAYVPVSSKILNNI